MKRYIYPGKKWSDVKKELYTPKEIEVANIRVEIISAMINEKKRLKKLQERQKTAT